MTDLLDHAIARLRDVPPAERESVAEAVLAILDEDDGDIRLTPEQVEEVRQTLEGLNDGSERTATDEEVQAMWRRFGL